jgi:hypothetical protein
MDRIHLAQDGQLAASCECISDITLDTKCGKFLDELSSYVIFVHNLCKLVCKLMKLRRGL